MRKSLIFILLILFSCQKDEIIDLEPSPQYKMIFEESISKVVDGQEFSFDVILPEEHHLLIEDNGSIITKESFVPEVGLNTRKIYTKALPKEKLKLILKNSVEEIKTEIVVE